METDDWPGDYDRPYALICKVVAQSNLSAETKPLLTRHLIERVANLEKKWPNRKHMKSRPSSNNEAWLRSSAGAKEAP